MFPHLPHRWPRRWTAALLAASLLPPAGRARDEAAEIRAMRAEIHSLEQRLDALEARETRRESASPPLAAQSAPAVAPAPSGVAGTAPAPSVGGESAVVTIGETGLRVASADGSSYAHVGGHVQLDSRWFFGDGGGLDNDVFVLRRARLILDGAFDRLYSFQFVPEFGGTSAPSIYDANFTVALSDALHFRLGKFKSPIGLEQLMSDAATFFVERSLVTDLVPNRDLGIQAGGRLGSGVLTYQAGLFSGVPDAANTTNQSFDNDKEAEARVIVQPFPATAGAVLHGFGAGVAGDVGRTKGAAAVPAGYKTDGQQTFFAFSSAVVGDGRSWRISPQAYDFAGPFGAVAEQITSAVTARPASGKPSSVLENRAWEVTASWVLTGENGTYDGVVPRAPFNWDKGTWGAWQIVLRYSDLHVDPAAFPRFASTATSADADSAWGLGVNWYLNRAIRITVDGFDDRFTTAGQPTAQILQHPEESLITRFQLAF